MDGIWDWNTCFLLSCVPASTSFMVSLGIALWQICDRIIPRGSLWAPKKGLWGEDTDSLLRNPGSGQLGSRNRKGKVVQQAQQGRIG